MKPAEIHVALRIISETITAEEMIRSLPMPPDKTWSLGQLRRGTIIKEVNNGVEYHSKNDGNSTLNRELNKLLLRMAPAGPALQGLATECQIHVSCAIYSSSTPELFVDEEAISRLAMCKASVDVDLYQLGCEDAASSA